RLGNELELEIGITTIQACDLGTYQPGAYAFACRQPDFPGNHAVDRANFLFGTQGFQFNALRVLNEFLPGWRQGNPGRGAGYQPGAQGGLQMCQSACHCRVVDAKLIGSVRKASLARNGQEIPDVVLILRAVPPVSPAIDRCRIATKAALRHDLQTVCNRPVGSDALRSH